MLFSVDGRPAGNDRGHDPSAVLEIDSMNAISGNQSARSDIPKGMSFSLFKPISWPDHVPFAVSAKPFAIIRPVNKVVIEQNDSITLRGDGKLDANIREEIRIAARNETPQSQSAAKSKGMTASLPVNATTYYTTYYIYSYDGRLLAEYDGNGVCTKDYIYHGTKLLAEYKTATSEYNYYTSDQINSTRTVTNGSGSVIYAGVADPFGGMQKEWTTIYNPSLKFSGKERESGCKADYFGARYYDHSKYRFLSVDPVRSKEDAMSNPQLWNLYAYCRNNPATYFDPDGREIRTNNQMLRLAIALAGATYTGGSIVNSAIQSPNVLNFESASLEKGNTGKLKEGSWVTEGGNFVTGNIVEITAQIDIEQIMSFGRHLVATVAHELMHGNTVITHRGRGNIAWQAALDE